MKSYRKHQNFNNLHQTEIGPFGNLGISISGSALALTSASTSALQKNFLFLRSFCFCLSKFLMKKTSMVKSFSSNPAHLPGSLSRCLQQLFCRSPLALASEERISIVDVISGVLKTPTAESWILPGCKFLIRNPIRDHFLEIFGKFWSTFKKLRSSFSEAYKACTPVKRGLLKVSRRATFRNIPCTC